MNIWDVIVLGIVALCAGHAVYRIIRGKKGSCGGCCESCGRDCGR